MTFTPHKLQPIYLESHWQRIHVIQYDSSQRNQPVPRRNLILFSFFYPLFSFFFNKMSCWISERWDVLAGVVELVLRLTIAEEKMELSVPISSAVCVFVASSSCVCERSYVCVPRAHLCLCVCCVECCREGHSCSTIIFPVYNDLHTGDPNGCPYILG